VFPSHNTLWKRVNVSAAKRSKNRHLNYFFRASAVGTVYSYSLESELGFEGLDLQQNLTPTFTERNNNYLFFVKGEQRGYHEGNFPLARRQ
jgi:hypothetical protein